MSEEQAVYYVPGPAVIGNAVTLEEPTGTREEQGAEFRSARLAYFETCLAYAREDEENAVEQVAVYLGRAKAARQRQAAIEEQIQELEAEEDPLELRAPDDFKERVLARIESLSRTNQERAAQGR